MRLTKIEGTVLATAFLQTSGREQKAQRENDIVFS
jgi:hypothetical protein